MEGFAGQKGGSRTATRLMCEVAGESSMSEAKRRSKGLGHQLWVVATERKGRRQPHRLMVGERMIYWRERQMVRERWPANFVVAHHTIPPLKKKRDGGH